MFEYKGVRIHWLGHDGFKIEDGSESIVIDPFKLAHDVRADYLLLTHEHFDHCNADDLKKIVNADTTVVAIASCSSELAKVSPKEVKTVKPGDRLRLGGFEVLAIPAYNTNKFSEPGKPFHPKGEGKVGYVLTTESGVKIYHTGDSDVIPEMDDLAPDVALIPVSGTYVMTADEAVQAVSKIRPNVAIPMHFGTIVGSDTDAEKFKKMAKCEVHILKKE